MMTTAGSSKPWVLAGGLTNACLGFVNAAYALIVQRVQLTQEMESALVQKILLMGLFGLLVGFVFAKIRGVIGLLDIYSQGIVAWVFLNTVMTLVTKGIGGLNTVDFAVSSAMSVAAGLLFAHFGLGFGAER